MNSTMQPTIRFRLGDAARMALLALLVAAPLAAQSRPLVMNRGGRTLVIERVEFSVANAQLLEDQAAVGTPGDAQNVRLDLRRNTVEVRVNGEPGTFRRVVFDLVPKNGWSVRVTGRSDSTRFDLRIPLERRVAMELLIPRRVKAPETMDVRIRMQASRWFRDFQSGALLDPAEDRETIVARIEGDLPAFNPASLRH